jgi:predicted small secreted protein
MTKLNMTAATMLVAVTFTILLLGGCNTISGAGKDVSAAGSAVDREARQARQY